MQHPWDVRQPKEETNHVSRSPGKPITVRNYYAFSEVDLNRSIAEMRVWFMDTPSDKHYAKVDFALEVALCAKALKRDSNVQTILDTLC